jgi:AraC-like DNA-binding protein/mannose-6-phosphate isomerase-like protein (cupin superfamily)
MKKLKRQVIPVHRIDSQSPLNIEFNYMEITDEYIEIMMKSSKNVIHRDDYYMFLFLESGSIIFTIDFEEIQLQEKSILYVRPGQVHFASSIQKTKGWFLAIDAMLIESGYKNLFERQFSTQKSISPDLSVIERISETARLLYSIMQAQSTIFSNNIILNLANTFIGIIAEQYADQQDDLHHNKLRSALIAHLFKESLSKNFKTVKSPSAYANMLNYSLSHLNESVKNITGFPVSYWIHQQVVLEAKRLLYYTDFDVKEIAFKLGYEDHTYFSRLFSKIERVSPGTFRHKIRE